MADELRLRIVVRGPLPDVPLRMQRGRHELVAPVRMSPSAVTFELRVRKLPRQAHS